MGDDDKPFACLEEGCGMRFANEDHLSVHRMKHEMSLALTAGGSKHTSNFLFVDQTPTPTKFLRNCEEIGLFHDLSKNPFEEAFKKAAQEQQVNNGDVTEVVVHVPLPGPSHDIKSTLSDVALDTPTVSLKTAVPQGHIDIVDTPEPLLNVIDQPDSEDIVVEESIEVAPTPLVEEEEEVIEVAAMSPAAMVSTSNSALPEPSPQSPAASSPVVEQMVVIEQDEVSPATSGTVVVTRNAPPATISFVETTAAVPAATIQVPTVVPAAVPATLATAAAVKKSVVTNVSAIHVKHEVPVIKQVVSPGGATSVAATLLKPSPAAATTATVLKPPQLATMQVLLQLPNGQTVPVHIPAAISSPTLQITTATTATSAATPKLATKRPTTIMAAATSTSTLAKQKLKQALVGNSQQSMLNANHSSVSVVSEAVERVNALPSPGNRLSPTPCASPSPSAGSIAHVQTSKAGPLIEMQDADTSTPFHKKIRKSNEEDADERRRKFLERNRAAAARCRMKRKSWIVNLEKKAEEMQSHNTKLQNEMTLLRKEVAHLKMLLLAHKDCPITKAQQAAGQLPVPLPDTQLTDLQPGHSIIPNLQPVGTIEIQEGCFQVLNQKGSILQAVSSKESEVYTMQPSPCDSDDVSMSNSHPSIATSPQPSSP